MEIVKENAEQIETKQSKMLVVVGVDEISKNFLKEALAHIISQAGYSVNIAPYEEPNEMDFHIVIGDEFLIEKEAKSALVFASYRNPDEMIETENEDSASMLNKFYELCKWMRSSKLAYCMDYNSPMNAKGLHNYSNLRNMVLPLVYAFQQTPPEAGKRRFDEVNPQTLIELLLPELGAQSLKASEKFEERKTELIKEGQAPDEQN